MLYWTDWSDVHPGIYRSPISNFSSQPLITTDIVEPIALAVDFTGKYRITKSLMSVISRPIYTVTDVFADELWPIDPVIRRRYVLNVRFCRAMRCISAAYVIMRCLYMCVSVCLSVCHVRELRENE